MAVDSRIVEMLGDPNPQNRLKAVQALAKVKDYEALQYLATVFREDRNQQVREMARKVGVHLRQYVSVDSGPANDDPFAADGPVSAVARERAQGYVQQALDWNIKGDNERAADMLVKAIATNPQLQNDSYVTGLAGTVTGLDSARAMQALRTRAGDPSMRATRRKSSSSSTQITIGVAAFVSLILLLSLLLPWVEFDVSIPFFMSLEVDASAVAILIDSEIDTSADFSGFFSGFLTEDSEMTSGEELSGRMFVEGLTNSSVMPTILWIVPLVAIFQLMFSAITLASGGEPSPWYWIGIGVSGILLLLPCAWFYLGSDAQTSMFADEPGISFTLLGIGFYVNVFVGVVMMGIGGFGMMVSDS